MGARKLSAVVGAAVLASAAVVLASMGSAGAAAGHHANTRVTIQGWPDGLFGVVKSPRARDCSKRRHVTLFKKKGAHRNPSKDERVGGDVARRNNGFYQWTVQTGETGPLYARAGRTRGCERAFSKIFHVRPRADVSQCNRGAPADVCIIGPDQLVAPSRKCRYHDDPASGACIGMADGPDDWGSGRKAELVWDKRGADPGRSVEYAAVSNSGPTAYLAGQTDDNSSALSISGADWARDAWLGYTPDISGVPPGEQGGALSFKVETSGGRTTISFSGYLYRKP